MKIIENLVQGSPEWLAHRRKYGNASEAPAMLALSPYITRNKLLEMKKLGTDQEFSDFVQTHVLDKGHEVEEKARKILESRLGEPLHPVVGVEGNLSVSFDGLTKDGRIGFECKQWNENLADLVEFGTVPDSHMPQVQQQLMLSGAEKVIFVVSDGTEDKFVTCDVYPDEDWFKRLRTGWAQFFKDLETYEYVEPEKAPEVAVIKPLPSVSMLVSAEVKKSNLPAFVSAAESFIANINTDLVTDEDFANAEQTVKFCKDAEAQLQATKEGVIAQTESLDEALKTLDHIKEQLRQKRLTLDKLVKSEKENRKNALIQNAQESWREFIKGLEHGRQLDSFEPDFANAIKGKKLLTAMQNAVDSALANAKVEAQIENDRLAENMEEYQTQASGYEYLFNDLNSILHHPRDAFVAIISSRIAQHKVQEEKRLEMERERVREEVKAEVEKESSVEKAKAKAAHVEAKVETPLELEQWFDEIKDNGFLPMDAEDADTWVWPLVLEAYRMGRNSK